MNEVIRVRAGAIIIERERILLIKYSDQHGMHYNLPGGGIEPGEAAEQAVKRELREEACVDIRVGELAFVYEYLPQFNNNRYGVVASLQLMFDCRLAENQTPKQPMEPDPHQSGVSWIPLNQLHRVTFYPNLSKELLEYAKSGSSIPLIKEQDLDQYS
ncbi:NUDIX domain-containing protein [Alkalicoccobacillus murimartini]|uniref:ADP-ribose pyrophosphatase YjhB (NUDIX family) n=1 Tax=Alkalicoccobacillus murimartini TaxID=171685 RepID=A0ABT9YGM7_9BACI|nr:NUDIX domain-containing protein [Alkalicoccobacillus murimartini]MDQ0206859.1 ADP-ribose pyrophosphatase YjhB (NUDIX family) [Alkalicoccobacillus murimartini]